MHFRRWLAARGPAASMMPWWHWRPRRRRSSRRLLAAASSRIGRHGGFTGASHFPAPELMPPRTIDFAVTAASTLWRGARDAGIAHGRLLPAPASRQSRQLMPSEGRGAARHHPAPPVRPRRDDVREEAAGTMTAPSRGVIFDDCRREPAIARR